MNKQPRYCRNSRDQPIFRYGHTIFHIILSRGARLILAHKPEVKISCVRVIQYAKPRYFEFYRQLHSIELVSSTKWVIGKFRLTYVQP